MHSRVRGPQDAAYAYEDYGQPVVEPVCEAAYVSQLVRLEPTALAGVVRLFMTNQTTAIPPITTAPASATHSTVTRPPSSCPKLRIQPRRPLFDLIFISFPFDLPPD